MSRKQLNSSFIMKLYDKPIKGVSRLPVHDLRQLARFNGIVKNYIKMCVIEKRNKNE